jgi:hypothetical protein
MTTWIILEFVTRIRSYPEEFSCQARQKNQAWTIQRYMQHWAQMIQYKDKQIKTNTEYYND